MEGLQRRRRLLCARRSEVWRRDSFLHFDVVRGWLATVSEKEKAAVLKYERAEENAYARDALAALFARFQALTAVAKCAIPHASLHHLQRATPGACKFEVGSSLRRRRLAAANFTDSAASVRKLKRALAGEETLLKQDVGEPEEADLCRILLLAQNAQRSQREAHTRAAALLKIGAQGALALHAAANFGSRDSHSMAWKCCVKNGTLLAELLAVAAKGWPELLKTRAYTQAVPPFVLVAASSSQQRILKLRLGGCELWKLWWGESVAKRFCRTGSVCSLSFTTCGFVADVCIPSRRKQDNRVQRQRAAIAVTRVLCQFHKHGFAVGACLNSCFLTETNEVGLGIPITVAPGDAASFAADLVVARAVLRKLHVAVEGDFTAAAEIHAAVSKFSCWICCNQKQVSTDMLSCSQGHVFCAACCYSTTSSRANLTGSFHCPFDTARRCQVEWLRAAELIKPEALEKLRARQLEVQVSLEKSQLKKQCSERVKLAALAACNRNVSAGVNFLLEEITESVMIDRCPKCTAAYDGFDGCAALVCSLCGCNFCAWCGQDCGADAHLHVLSCARSPRKGTWAATAEEHKAVRAESKAAELRALVEAAPECEELRAALSTF